MLTTQRVTQNEDNHEVSIRLPLPIADGALDRLSRAATPWTGAPLDDILQSVEAQQGYARREKIVIVSFPAEGKTFQWRMPDPPLHKADRILADYIRGQKEFSLTARTSPYGSWKCCGFAFDTSSIHDERNVTVHFCRDDSQNIVPKRIEFHPDSAAHGSKCVEVWDLGQFVMWTDLAPKELADEIKEKQFGKKRTGGGAILHDGPNSFELHNCGGRGTIFSLLQAHLKTRNSVVLETVLGSGGQCALFDFKWGHHSADGHRAIILFVKDDRNDSFRVGHASILSTRSFHPTGGPAKRLCIIDADGGYDTELSLPELALELKSRCLVDSNEPDVTFTIGNVSFAAPQARPGNNFVETLFRQGLLATERFAITLPADSNFLSYGIQYHARGDFGFATNVRLTYLKFPQSNQHALVKREFLDLSSESSPRILLVEDITTGRVESPLAAGELIELYNRTTSSEISQSEISIELSSGTYNIQLRSTNSTLLRALSTKLKEEAAFQLTTRISEGGTFTVLGFSRVGVSASSRGRLCRVTFERKDDGEHSATQLCVYSDLFRHLDGRPKIQEYSAEDGALRTELSTPEIVASIKQLNPSKGPVTWARLEVDGANHGEIKYISANTPLVGLLRDSLLQLDNVVVTAPIQKSHFRALGLSWAHNETGIPSACTARVVFSLGIARSAEVRDSSGTVVYRWERLIEHPTLRPAIAAPMPRSSDCEPSNVRWRIPDALAPRAPSVAPRDMPGREPGSPWRSLPLEEKASACELPRIRRRPVTSSLRDVLMELEAVDGYRDRPLAVECRLDTGEECVWRIIPPRLSQLDCSIVNLLLSRESFTLTGAAVGTNGSWSLAGFYIRVSGAYTGRVISVTFKRTREDGFDVDRVVIPSSFRWPDGRSKVAELIDYGKSCVYTELTPSEIASELSTTSGAARSTGGICVHDGTKQLEVKNIVAVMGSNNLPRFFEETLTQRRAVLFEANLTALGFQFRRFTWNPGLRYLSGRRATLLFTRSGNERKFTPERVSVSSEVPVAFGRDPAPQALVISNGAVSDTALAPVEIARELEATPRYTGRARVLTIDIGGDVFSVRPPSSTGNYFDDALRIALSRHKTLCIETDSPESFNAYGISWNGTAEHIKASTYRLTFSQSPAGICELDTIRVSVPNPNGDHERAMSPLFTRRFGRKSADFIESHVSIESLAAFLQDHLQAGDRRADVQIFFDNKTLTLPIPASRTSILTAVLAKTLRSIPKFSGIVPVASSGKMSFLSTKYHIADHRPERNTRYRFEFESTDGGISVVGVGAYSPYFTSNSESKIEWARTVSEDSYRTELTCAELLETATRDFPAESSNPAVVVTLSDGRSYSIGAGIRRTMWATLIGRALAQEADVRVTCPSSGKSFSLFGLKCSFNRDVPVGSMIAVTFNLGNPSTVSVTDPTSGKVLFEWKCAGKRIADGTSSDSEIARDIIQILDII